MIEGERGEAVLSQVLAHRMDMLVDGDQISSSLIGSCIAEALRKGDSPRAVASALWEAMPSDQQWGSMRESIEQKLDEMEEEAA